MPSRRRTLSPRTSHWRQRGDSLPRLGYAGGVVGSRRSVLLCFDRVETGDEVIPGVGGFDIGLKCNRIPPALAGEGVVDGHFGDELFGGVAFRGHGGVGLLVVGFAFDDPVVAVSIKGDEVGAVVRGRRVGDGGAVAGVEAFPPLD